jgi:hypothetical protein
MGNIIQTMFRLDLKAKTIEAFNFLFSLLFGKRKIFITNV